MQPETKTEEPTHSADAGKKIYWPRLAMMLWIFFFPVWFMMLIPPPEKVGAYYMFACLALVPLFWGSRGYKVFGVIALILSMWAAAAESRAGVRYKDLQERIRTMMLQRNAATNRPATNAMPATHE